MKRSVIILLLSVMFLSCGKKKEEAVVTKTSETPVVEKTTGDKVSENNTEEKINDEKPNKNVTNKSGGENYISLKSGEAAGKIGSSALVEGYVADVTVREKVAYLNFDKKYPNNTFTAVVFASKFDEFGDLSQYKNKNVEVKGKITEYSGKAQVILNSKSQIKIINK